MKKVRSRAAFRLLVKVDIGVSLLEILQNGWGGPGEFVVFTLSFSVAEGALIMYNVANS